ncbi:ParM/StbA family protein [Aphanothece hegewaldii]|nr:ParM/StbA family protein [Aphanothece hegewaldii]
MAIDYGGSITKVIGGVSNRERRILAMPPDVIELPKTFLELHQGEIGTASPENKVWIAVNGKSYAVGMYARTLAIENPRLTQPKIATALSKTLAAIWVLKEQLRLSNTIRLDLCCVLPIGEYQDKDKLKRQLEKAFHEFETPSGQLKVELSEFNCKPEGAGVYMMHTRKRGVEAQQKILAVVMLGYRNTSVLVFRQGNLVDKATSPLGFARLLKNVIAQTSGQTLERLAPSVVQYLEGKDDSGLLSILLSDEPIEELAQLKNAIAIAQEKHQIELCGWLNEIIPRLSEEIVLCGGTADTLQNYLFKLWNSQEIYLHGGVELPEDIKALKMGYRFADIWIMWDYFIDKLMKNKLALPIA